MFGHTKGAVHLRGTVHDQEKNDKMARKTLHGKLKIKQHELYEKQMFELGCHRRRFHRIQQNCVFTLAESY
jgi:protein subunit release factor B